MLRYCWHQSALPPCEERQLASHSEFLFNYEKLSLMNYKERDLSFAKLALLVLCNLHSVKAHSRSELLPLRTMTEAEWA
jgi:hypothetical protein